MPAIDFDGPVPVYLQLAAILRAQIASGELPPDRPIPSKVVLTQRYGVSRGSVDHAVRVLKDTGAVYTVIGRGVYVATPEDA